MWLALLLALAARAGGVPGGLSGWEVLQRAEGPDDIWVGCTQAEGSTWCRSRGLVPAPPERLVPLLSDFDHYPQVFRRVTRAEVVAEHTVHIVLDMPFPLADRDYVARFTASMDGDARVYRWEAVADPPVPAGDAVRLEHAAGEWRLEPRDGGTLVTYTWNAELGGDIPDWALPRARLTQGTEVIEWLRDAVD